MGIWTLTPEDERELDRWEGVPKSYEKTIMELEVTKTDGIKARLNCLIYIKPARSVLDKPDPGYVKTCVDGYRSFNFDEGLLYNAIQNAAWCTLDPICIQSSGQGSESMNLAACRNCALLPETCCENGNRLLDRGVAVGTLEKPKRGISAGFVTSKTQSE